MINVFKKLPFYDNVCKVQRSETDTKTAKIYFITSIRVTRAVVCILFVDPSQLLKAQLVMFVARRLRRRLVIVSRLPSLQSMARVQEEAYKQT